MTSYGSFDDAILGSHFHVSVGQIIGPSVLAPIINLSQTIALFLDGMHTVLVDVHR